MLLWPVRPISGLLDGMSNTFVHGVASGDPTTDAVIIWTRISGHPVLAVDVTWTVALDPQFDLIVANLPYISSQDRHLLSREVLHDSEVALFGGVHGDELIRELIEQAPAHLRPGGLLALETGIGQSEALSGVLTQKKYKDICSKNDYSGTSRFMLARYG